MSTVEVPEAETETEFEVVDACPECDGELVDDDLETFCGGCGLVVDEHVLDRGPTYGDDEYRKHSAGVVTHTRHDRGIGGTVIGYAPELDTPQLRRVRRWQSQAQYGSKRERGQVYVNAEIGRIATALGQRKGVKEQACTLYKRAMEKELILGRSLDGFAGACVLAILRVHGKPFTPDDVTDVTRTDVMDINRAYQSMNEAFGLPTPPPRPSTYIPRYASQLDVDAETEALALEYAKAVDEAGTEFGGRAPSGLAGACLYQASWVQNGECQGRGLTQQQVASAIGKTPVTVRTGRDILLEILDE